MNLKLTLQLSPELRTRLGIESATTGKSNSEIVATLINANLQLPDDLEQFAADLKNTRSAPNADLEKTPSDLDAKTDDAKTDERQGKNTSLYLPVLTSMRLHFHMLKTGEDRRSTIIRLIDQHIVPWATYDPRTSYVRPRDNGRRKNTAEVSDSAPTLS